MLQETTVNNARPVAYEGDVGFGICCGDVPEHEAEKICRSISRVTGKKVTWKKELCSITFCCVHDYNKNLKSRMRMVFLDHLNAHYPELQMNFF